MSSSYFGEYVITTATADEEIELFSTVVIVIMEQE